MFKGLGLLAMAVFVILASFIGSVGPGFSIYFLSSIFVVTGVLAFSLLQFPEPLAGDRFKQLMESEKTDVTHLATEVEELAVIIRRDGMLVAETFRKNLKDKKLQYLIKRSMEGFEKKQLSQWIESHRDFQEQQFSLLQNYLDRVLLTVPVVGLLGTVFQLMHQPVSLATAFVPFILALFLQLSLQAFAQEKINEGRRKNILYFSILQDGVGGIMDGVTAEFIREQLSARLGVSHLKPGQRSVSPAIYYGLFLIGIALYASQGPVAPPVEAASVTPPVLSEPVAHFKMPSSKLQDLFRKLRADDLLERKVDGVTVEYHEDSIQISLNSDELFETGEYALRETWIGTLDRFAKILKPEMNSGLLLKIHGYAEQGKSLEQKQSEFGASDFTLASERAEWVARYLEREWQFAHSQSIELIAHGAIAKGKRIDLEVKYPQN